MNTENAVMYFLIGVGTGVLTCLMFKTLLKLKRNRVWHYQYNPATKLDIQIIAQTLETLNNPGYWDKSSDRLCIPDKRQSLFCTLAFVSRELTGKYEHWGTVSQELRKTIEEKYAERWSEHPIMDFNSHPDTKHQDILNILQTTKDKLESRAKIQKL